MMFYSWVFIIIAILAIVFSVIRFNHKKLSLPTFLVITVAMLFVILFAIFPESSNIFANLVGIGRGLDFVFILAILVLIYINVKLFFIIEDMQNNMTKIVKYTALNNEIKLEDEEDS